MACLSLTPSSAPKARLGGAQYWSPLENGVSNFKLIVLSRQKEFLSVTGSVGKLRFSSFSFCVQFVCQSHFGTCKLEKGVATKSRNCSNCGSGIHNLKDFEILSPESMKLCEFMTFTLKRWLFLERTLQLRLLTNFQVK